MPAYYQETLRAFVDDDPPAILWKLAQANAAARFPLTPQAIEAWNTQLPFLTSGISELLRVRPDGKDWGVLLEYPIPIIGKRIDAVLIAHDVIIVIETKTGSSQTSAIRQVDDYALNLACFHEYSEHRTIVPLVVADSQSSSNSTSTEFDTLIEQCCVTSTSKLGQTLTTICCQHVQGHKPAIKIEDWNLGRFTADTPDHRCRSRPLFWNGCI